jgi:formamidopyrimidine-DNA glycosylase
MPELPEVAALAAFLTARTAGRSIEHAEVLAFRALKTSDPPVAALSGRPVTGAEHRGKFVVLDCDGVDLVFHLALAGWLTWHAQVPALPERRERGPLAARVRLDDGSGFDLTEEGDFKRLAVYVVTDPAQVPGIARLGPDALDPALDAATLARLFGGRRARLKNLLTNQQVIAGIGNAYSDEILHTARLSPFKTAAAMTPDDFEHLQAAIRSVLSEAVSQLTGREPETLKDDKREGLRVHRRTGERCPVCGDVIREVSETASAFQYCPTCQTGGELLSAPRASKSQG